MHEDMQEKPLSILIVEDSAVDYESIMRAFKRLEITNPVHYCKSGDDALDFLYHRGVYSSHKAEKVDIIMLDLNLPGTDGREVIEIVKHDLTLKHIPIIVLTTSNSQSDVKSCYLNGANAYINKPVKWEDLLGVLGAFKKFWLESNLVVER